MSKKNLTFAPYTKKKPIASVPVVVASKPTKAPKERTRVEELMNEMGIAA